MQGLLNTDVYCTWKKNQICLLNHFNTSVLRWAIFGNCQCTFPCQGFLGQFLSYTLNRSLLLDYVNITDHLNFCIELFHLGAKLFSTIFHHSHLALCFNTVPSTVTVRSPRLEATLFLIPKFCVFLWSLLRFFWWNEDHIRIHGHVI